MDTDEARKESPNEIVKTPSGSLADLEQVFQSCHAYALAIRDSVPSEDDVMHLNYVDQTLRWVSSQLSSSAGGSPRQILLLLFMLQDFYELLRTYVDSMELHVERNIVEHGQIHVILEQIADQLELTYDGMERVNRYIHSVQRDIIQAGEQTSPIEKIVIGSEIWVDQLAALVLCISPRYIEELKDSVNIAIEEIKCALDSTTDGHEP